MSLACNDVSLKSWVEVPEGSHFPIQNLPFGVFSVQGGPPVVGVAIGEQVLDLHQVAMANLLASIDAPLKDVFASNSLNGFLNLGKPIWRAVRERVSVLLRDGNAELKEQSIPLKTFLWKMAEVQLHRPVEVKNYVDFYSSEEHATNVGKMVRDPNNPLLPNWKHIPIGYNGRANTVVVSGTEFRRPKGQIKPPQADLPVFEPCRNLDFELEVGTVIGSGTKWGTALSPEQAEDAVFGLVLLNDWSARDIQTWEYQPLGPFLAKSFCTSISPWVVTLDALAPFRTGGPVQNPPVLPYLQFNGAKNFNLNLFAKLKTPKQTEDVTICETNFKYMYFNLFQQVAHLTSNGTPLEVGDVYGSGTVSGPVPGSFGSLLEICWKGTKPLTLPSGETRVFLQDEDTLTLTGYSEHVTANGKPLRIGFGEVSGKVLPAL